MSSQNINSKSSRYLTLMWIILIGVVLVGGIYYWRQQIYFPSTNDAYVQANIIPMAAQVNGPVSKIYVQDHQFVKKGQLLFDIDQQPFLLAVQQARAQLDLTIQKITGNAAGVQAAAATVEQQQAAVVDSEKNYQRIITLVKRGDASKASGDDAYAQWQEAKAALNVAQNQLIAAQRKLGVLGQQNAAIMEAQANLAQAQLNLDHTHITAPSDGNLINFTLREGAYIAAGQPLFSLIEANNWWTDANFQETDLTRINIGQSAKIKLDMYPGHVFSGKVIAISRGSGAAFAILPAENATGNWVKVTQRFPVKIIFDNTDTQFPLRVGASATVIINTKSS